MTHRQRFGRPDPRFRKGPNPLMESGPNCSPSAVGSEAGKFDASCRFCRGLLQTFAFSGSGPMFIALHCTPRRNVQCVRAGLTQNTDPIAE